MYGEQGPVLPSLDIISIAQTEKLTATVVDELNLVTESADWMTKFPNGQQHHGSIRTSNQLRCNSCALLSARFNQTFLNNIAPISITGDGHQISLKLSHNTASDIWFL